MNADLYGVTQDLNALTFRTFELFAIAGVLFYAITKIITLGARVIAARLFRY
jgi:polar amino acid transport system permease protein